jgi:hypothetical protein
MEAVTSICNKGRGAGARVTVAMQSIYDVEVALGDKAKALQLFDNLTNKIQFRVMTDDTAKEFSSACGPVNIDILTESRSKSPAFGNTGNRVVAAFSTNIGKTIKEEDVDKVSKQMILDLPVGQCYGYLESETWKLRMPLFKKVDEDVDYWKTVGAL